jgi:hypothetical protein
MSYECFLGYAHYGGFNTRLETSALHRKEDIYVFFGISTDLSRPFDDF